MRKEERFQAFNVYAFFNRIEMRMVLGVFVISTVICIFSLCGVVRSVCQHVPFSSPYLFWPDHSVCRWINKRWFCDFRVCVFILCYMLCISKDVLDMDDVQCAPSFATLSFLHSFFLLCINVLCMVFSYSPTKRFTFHELHWKRSNHFENYSHQEWKMT